MGFKIDKDGNCLYTTDRATIYYPIIEEIKDDSGKVIGKRTVTKEYTPKPLVSTAEQMGWAKKVVFKDVVVNRIPDPLDYNKIKPKLFLRTIEIDAERYFEFNRCNHCVANEHGNKFHYLRAMTDSVVAICWACAVHYGRTAFMIQTLDDVRSGTMSGWCKVLEEKPISAKEAIEFYRETGKVVDGTVRLLLNERKDKLEAG
jgi:hypothetical protein